MYIPPPTLAKSAIEDAPSEKPDKTFNTISMFVPHSILLYIINRLLKPRTPRPTTPRPMTEPPANATSRALANELLAALVVLTLAFVATFIPINPASAEQIAPTTKETATIELEPSSEFPLNTSKTATATTKTDKILYSAFKNDIAPSAIFLAIFDIFSSPTGCLETHEFFQKTKKSATIPKAGKKLIINSMLYFLNFRKNRTF